MAPPRSEKSIVNGLLYGFRRAGAFAEKNHGIGGMRIGTPDIYACYLGVFIAIEVKRPGERPTPAQEQVLREIAAAGGLTYVLDDASEVKRVLQDARRLRAKGG